MLTAVAVSVAVLVFNHVGRIGWAAVVAALGQLSWSQLLVLLVILTVRQVLHASRLRFSLSRAFRR